ncbi:hypothetical protein [Glaciihabitans sp. dw_435]|uniref:hypothetical protein n=1 Tax=Glaciihabitans sp. dw_435 TaxID=2720081 RepID=UPI001BD3B945|nr:hypothetical protein [Glaciihabitans sp. dw_435]
MDYEGTRSTALLSKIDFGNTWLRWCDRSHDWLAESSVSPSDDSLASQWGTEPMHVREFIDAYRNAGARVTQVRRTRSFDVDITAGDTRVNVLIQLGRGINTEECYLRIYRGDTQVEGSTLHGIARTILLEQTGVDHLYPRPNLVSRSHLEVTSRELVPVMQYLAGRY